MKDIVISDAVKYIGADDKDLDLFESQYIVPNGVSYNSYVILDEKIAVMDTIDTRKTDEWKENLERVLDGRTPDYLVVSHLEPDHAGSIKEFADKYPEAKIVASAKAIAMRSRGTPRIANRLIKRVADFAIVKHDGKINENVANESLDLLKIDEFGLDNTDRALLNLIIDKYDGGPVGIETIAAALSEDVRTIEDVCEPYLLQAGLLQRTPRGRKVSPEGYRHLGIKIQSMQTNLFD
mgnify:CR=1 FL=1